LTFNCPLNSPTLRGVRLPEDFASGSRGLLQKSSLDWLTLSKN
jgi:hypothetical protein